MTQPETYDNIDHGERRRQMKAAVYRATRAGVLAADVVLVDAAATDPRLRYLPPSLRDSLVVEAAVAYLVGHGLIAVCSQARWPVPLPLDTPEFLRPDVAAAVERHERVTSALQMRQR